MKLPFHRFVEVSRNPMSLIGKQNSEFRILNFTFMRLFSNRIGGKAENTLDFQVHAEAERIL